MSIQDILTSFSNPDLCSWQDIADDCANGGMINKTLDVDTLDVLTYHKSWFKGVSPDFVEPPLRDPIALAKFKQAPPHKVISHVNLDKVGQNDPCPCGSGKKYKKCCLMLAN